MNDIELDMSWVDELNETINNYKEFYKEKCFQVFLYYLYISKTNELLFIKKEKIGIENGICKSEMLLSKNKLAEFKLSSLAKFNIDIEPHEIVNGFFFKDIAHEYFTTYNTIQDIHFNDTVSFLQNINTLFLVFKEQEQTNKEERKKDKTKKDKTKKVSFLLHHNKTRKNFS
jgi:hypothetical protein